jgi:hypothetical protein
MNPKHVPQLEALVRAGAKLWAFGTAIPVGDILVRGRSIVFAEQWALDQHHVHRVDDITLEPLSQDVINWRLPDGSLYGTLERMDAEEAAQCHWEAWRQELDDPQIGRRWRGFFEEEAAWLLGER